MKKIFLPVLFLLSLCLSARGQVVIFNDNLWQQRMSEIHATVLDSLTNEPVGFASVYVVPSKDTTITNFTLSNDKGEATLDDVPFGSYVFHVEMLGYKPFIKERYFRNAKEDMGTIRLKTDTQFLQAATVTDIGNPIVVKQDTVEFNASSFRVGSNAMLKDLLKRMPGMEVTEDGKVKFNGEEIDRITVGGRTFFFGDQSTALSNLPAAVVDKVRVIDRESESTRATGLQDGQREKVLDVGLKKEYEKGWFGNAGVKGGSTLAAAKADEPLRDNRGFLWGANALVSAYNEKDQVTVIASGQNVSDGGAVVIVFNEDEGMDVMSGLSTSAQAGVNANTSRIKGVETTVGVNAKYSDVDSADKTLRTTYQESGDLESESISTGKQYASSVTGNAEFQKESGKVWFHLRPDFRYSFTNTLSEGNSLTSRESVTVNESERSSKALNKSKTASLSADVTFRDLGGKEGRQLALNLDGAWQGDNGESTEYSLLKVGGATADLRDLRYNSLGTRYGFEGSVQYTEPLGKKWLLSASAAYTYSRRDRTRDAFEADGTPNDYYSSLSQNNYTRQRYSFTTQYKWSEHNWITLGATVNGSLNETFSKSYGVEEKTGVGEWDWYVTPAMRFQYNPGMNRFYAGASGWVQQPSASAMLPVLSVADLSRLTLGNIYLRPFSTTYLNAGWTRNDTKRFSTIMVNLFGQITSSPVGYARWYDPSGILYSIPVNARKPSAQLWVNGSYTTPLDSKKLWSVTVNGYMTYTSSASYQAMGTLPGLDKDAFDYSAFMEGFWGDESGSRFYGGERGFTESTTRVFGPGGTFSLKFNPERFSLVLNTGILANLARYSLDKSLNMNTTDSHVGFEGSYVTPHEFELETDLSYHFYTGFKEGYNQPEWQWNAGVSRNIGAFNISLTVHDILNQTRGRSHTVTANYEEDAFRLVMGRYFLIGVKWNFGKMNAANSRRAQSAAWNMVW